MRLPFPNLLAESCCIEEQGLNAFNEGIRHPRVTALHTTWPAQEPLL